MCLHATISTSLIVGDDKAADAGAAFCRMQHTLSNFTSLVEVHEQELAYVAEQIALSPDNESAWNYLWGLYTLPGCGKHDMGKQQKVRQLIGC